MNERIAIFVTPYSVDVHGPTGYVGGLTASRLAEGPQAVAEALTDIFRRLGVEADVELSDALVRRI